ncbi:MAG: HAD family hydrolase [Bacillota bacterium]|jgi:FMN phosphatase YigB (HAD superfamily)
MARYALFDLDGTLLPIDTDTFLKHYLRLLGASFADGFDPPSFVQQVMASTYVTIGDSSPGVTNQDKFMADFLPKIGRSAEEMLPRFDQFYREQFPRLGELVQPEPLARQLVDEALRQGYRIVVATNPVFPREAVLQRLVWAKLDDLPWEHISSYENSCHCKPHPAYYAELLERLGARPEDCLHFGNDLEEDLAASAVGISVVIIDNHLINRRQRSWDGCLFHGDYASTLAWFRRQHQSVKDARP